MDWVSLWLGVSCDVGVVCGLLEEVVNFYGNEVFL